MVVQDMRHRALIVRPKTALVVRPRPETKEPLWAVSLGLAMLGVRYARWWRARPQARAGRPPSVAERRQPSRHADPRAAVQERGRGRHAETPSEIPALGWKDILIRTYKEMSDDRVMSLAAGVTYYALLAIFPGISALLSLYGLFADPATMNQHLAALSTILPGGAIEIVGDQMKRIAAKGDASLGLTFFFGLAIALWSANAGVEALFDALNVVYEEQERRSFVKFTAITLAFTLCAILFLLLAVALVAVVPAALEFVGLKDATQWLVSILRWPLLFVGVAFAIAVVYRFGPNRADARWRWITWGSAAATAIWMAGSMLFSWYVANFGSYDKTYGSLGAVIGFMTWIWLSSIVILMGAELDSEMEHQTAKDTTTRPTEPMGQRGATMADTVGQAQGS